MARNTCIECANARRPLRRRADGPGPCGVGMQRGVGMIGESYGARQNLNRRIRRKRCGPQRLIDGFSWVLAIARPTTEIRTIYPFKTQFSETERIPSSADIEWRSRKETGSGNDSTRCARRTALLVTQEPDLNIFEAACLPEKISCVGGALTAKGWKQGGKKKAGAAKKIGAGKRQHRAKKTRVASRDCAGGAWHIPQALAASG
ncbi:hypothetical protein B0H19DRAFT_1085080 [Mycena capillaripes]|nr:hypothetical protein B0H19DRAFT_1085080 [Mycena capillaripes]